MRNKLKQLALRIWSNVMVRRTVHTFWQAFIAVFLVGVPLVVSATRTHGVGEGEKALISLGTASLAAGLAAVRTGIINLHQARKAG